MAAILALLVPIGGKVLSWLGKFAILSGPLAFIAPAVTGIAQLIGGIFQALYEIILAMSKSPEGRVMLAILAAGLGLLYLRFHYIEEGKAMTRPQIEAAQQACRSQHHSGKWPSGFRIK